MNKGSGRQWKKKGKKIVTRDMFFYAHTQFVVNDGNRMTRRAERTAHENLNNPIYSCKFGGGGISNAGSKICKRASPHYKFYNSTKLFIFPL